MSVMLCAAAFGTGALAQEPTPVAGDPSADAQRLVGFWMVDVEGMSTDPRYAPAMESEQGRAGIAFAQGALFEFSPDHHMRTHLGKADDHVAAITPMGDGVLRLEPEGGAAWLVQPLSDDAFVQKFPEVGFEILWKRSWEPFEGTWRVSLEALDQEQWFKKLTDAQRESLQSEVEAMRLSVDGRGNVTGHWNGADRLATLSLESTTPPAGALVEDGAQGRGGAAHLVRRDDSSASLYAGDQTWPLEREHRPSAVAVGNWKFDIDRAMTMDWLKRSVPEGRTLEQFLKENVKLDVLIPVTATEWNNQAYTVVDERGNQFAAEAGGNIVFWVKVIDEDHISQFAGGGREFPLVRAEGAGE